MRAVAVTASALVLVFSSDADAAGLSRLHREKMEVRAIFAMLIARMEPGDGWHFDVPCIFSEDWIDFVPNKGNSAKSVNPHALLSLRDALDPKGQHPEKFCDRKMRNDQAKAAALALAGGDNARISTADMDFSYPIFNRGLTRAVLQHSGGNDSWLKNGKSDFVSSWRYVYLRKRHGVWTARFETLGIAN
jgi:hypothetical protein